MGVPLSSFSIYPVALLEDETVFMLDGYQERIRLLIVNLVASAVVLNLDDDGLELANFVVHEKRPEQGIILSGFALVADEDRHDTATLHHLAEPLDAQVQHGLEFIKIFSIAQVISVF